MAKKKTSRRQKVYGELKPGVKFRRMYPTKELLRKNKNEILQSLIECLIDGDREAFKEIFSGYLLALNISKLSKKSKISRRTIYNALSENGNPSLDTFFKLTHHAFSKAS